MLRAVLLLLAVVATARGLAVHDSEDVVDEAKSGLSYLQGRVEKEAGEDAERTEPSVASLQLYLTELEDARRLVMAEMEGLEQTLNDGAHISSFLPKQLQELMESNTLVADGHAAAVRACGAAVTQQSQRQLHATAENETLAAVAEKLYDMHREHHGPTVNEASALVALVMSELGVEVKAALTEQAEAQCMCNQLASAAAGDKEDMDHMSEVDRARLEAAGSGAAGARQALADKLVVAQMYEHSIADVRRELSEVQHEADERRRHRESAIKSINSLRNILEGLTAAPEEAERAALGAAGATLGDGGGGEPGLAESGPAVGAEPGTAMASCAAIKELSPQSESGIYWIHLNDIPPLHEREGMTRAELASEMRERSFQVYCDMTTQGGGWTYVLRFNTPGSPGLLDDVDDEHMEIVYPVSGDKAMPASPPTSTEEARAAAAAFRPIGTSTVATVAPATSPAPELPNGTTNGTAPTPLPSASPSATSSYDPSGLGINPQVDTDCIGNDFEKVCEMGSVEECSALCTMRSLCTHFVYNYQTADIERYNATLNATGEMLEGEWSDGCCWLKSIFVGLGGGMCAERETVVGKLSAVDARMAHRKHELDPRTATAAESALLQTATGKSDKRDMSLMVNMPAYLRFASRPNMEVLRVTDVVDRGASIRTQYVRVALGANTLTGVLSACPSARKSSDAAVSSCVRVNNSVTLYSAPPAAVGCCGGADKVDYVMGSSTWLTCTPRVDGREHVGLATSIDLDNARCPFAASEDKDEEQQCSQVVCDWSGIERMVAGDPQHYTVDSGDLVVSDLFSALDVFADPADVHGAITQVVLLGMRPSACPTTAAGGVCNGVGYCEDGACVCREGWAGAKCDAYECDGGCQNGGTCTGGPGVCQCPPSHTGRRCEDARSLADYGCEMPPAPSGTDSVQMECSGEGEPLTVCRYECDTGTSVRGSLGVTGLTRICAGDGRWNVDAPVCVPVLCEKAPTPMHSQVVCQGNSLGDTCELSCEDGYQIVLQPSAAPVPATTVQCKSAGDTGPPVWLPAIDACTRRRCGALERPEGSVGTCDKDAFGDECTLQCESDDHKVVGGTSLTARCQADGRWSRITGRCAPIEEVKEKAAPQAGEAAQLKKVDTVQEDNKPKEWDRGSKNEA